MNVERDVRSARDRHAGKLSQSLAASDAAPTSRGRVWESSLVKLLPHPERPGRRPAAVRWERDYPFDLAHQSLAASRVRSRLRPLHRLASLCLEDPASAAGADQNGSISRNRTRLPVRKLERDPQQVANEILRAVTAQQPLVHAPV